MTEEQRERDRERSRRWHHANKDRVRENRRKWRAANPEKRAAADRRYREVHPEKAVERSKRHQKLFPEKCAERARRWRENNRERAREIIRAYFQTPEGKEARRLGEQRRRARKAGCKVEATAADVRQFLGAAHACEYCAGRFTAEKAATLDHRTPLARGGPHSLDNFAAACRSCNSRKGTKTDMEYKAYLAITTGAECLGARGRGL